MNVKFNHETGTGAICQNISCYKYQVLTLKTE